MAYSKIILNGETLMDVTSDTVVAGSLLSGTTATKNDGTKVTGNIANKTASNLTVSGSTVTTSAGYYPSAVSKSVAGGTATTPATTITKNPTITLSTTTGVVTATYAGSSSITPTVSAGYVTTGTAGTVSTSGTSTYQLTMRSAADMTVAAQSVTAPAGYYSTAFTKAVTTTTHPNPTAAIVSSTGVVTASHTQTTGYVTSGTTTGTLNLTTQGATTYNTSTADQTIASNRWLTGTQTIKSVTTTNLTAANIAEGVTVKIGDANNASRITQITGTHSGATSYTATISGSGNSSYCYVTYNGTKYYSNGNTFTYKAGDTLTIYSRGNSVTINGDTVSLSSYSYTYTLPVGNITINLTYSSSTSNNIKVWGLVQPTNTYSITAAGTHNVYKYSAASVVTGSAFPPAVTITKAPTFSMNSATGVVTASYTGSSSITPTVTAGYISQGTAGTISTTGTSTYQLTSKAAATIYPSTADQTIASYRWLTGTQTIKSVITSNLIAENIAEGVTVTVGDSSNASRITQVTGTHSGAAKYTATFPNSNQTGATDVYFTYNGVKSNELGTSFTFHAGDTIVFTCNSSYSQILDIDGVNTSITQPYTYTLPSSDIDLYVYAQGSPSGIVAYLRVQLHSLTIDQIAIRTISGNISGNAKSIVSYAFYDCYKLTTVSFPFCGKIGSSAFFSCFALTTASFPVCTTIDIGAFARCTQLTTVSFPVCTMISTYAFSGCSALTIASFPVCTTIGKFAFGDCSALTTVSFPSCTTIDTSAFSCCFALTTASFPSCTIIAAYAFYRCSALTTASFPVCTRISSYAFYNCSALRTASFPVCTTISSYAFNNCYRLSKLYLTSISQIPNLSTNVFNSTPIGGYDELIGDYGSVYVPSSLYTSFLTATNWTSISARIVSI